MSSLPSLGDARLDRRRDRIAAEVAAAGSICPARAGASPASRLAQYRFYASPRFSYRDLVAGAVARTRERLRAAGHDPVGGIAPATAPATAPVLAVGDTTAVRLGHLSGRLKVNDPDLGPIAARAHGSAQQPGFLAHATYVTTAPVTDGPAAAIPALPVGLAALQVWNRGYGAPDKRARDYKALAPRDKEQAKWRREREALVAIGLAGRVGVTGGQLAGAGAGAYACYHVCDREADAYLDLEHVRASGLGFVYRASHDRRCREAGGGGEEGARPWRRLSAVCASWAPVSVTRVRLRARDGVPARTCELELRCGCVEVACPRKARRHAAGATAVLGFVEARERGPGGRLRLRSRGAPRGEDAPGNPPIRWRLYCPPEGLSPGDAGAAALARRYVSYYAARWEVEELFAGLKSRGYGAEGAYLSTGAAIKKQFVIGAEAAVEIRRLTLARDGSDAAPAHEVLGYDDAGFLAEVNASLETAGAVCVNPHEVGTVSYVSWICARLGGWMGNTKSSVPGTRRMTWGYEKLALMRAGYLLARAGPPPSEKM